MSSKNAVILVIDDEVQIRRFLRVALESHGYDILEGASAAEGLSLAMSHLPDMIILDLGLPDKDGQELLVSLREWYLKPILVLSVRDDESSIVNALDQGANDYLRKPFILGELLARLRVLARLVQSLEKPEPLLTFGNLHIDLVGRRVCVEGGEIKLTVTEYELLTLLAKNAGKILTHKYILNQIWGPKSAEHTQYLRVYIGHLRQKIEKNPARPVLIITEPAVGYRFIG